MNTTDNSDSLSHNPQDQSQPQTVEADQAEHTSPSELEEEIVAALKTVYDPEIPVDIYELGLIYNIDVDPAHGHVDIDMTLTAPGCPVAGAMPEWVREAVEDVPGIHSARVEMVWEPPWTPDLMSMRAKLELNMF